MRITHMRLVPSPDTGDGIDLADGEGYPDLPAGGAALPPTDADGFKVRQIPYGYFGQLLLKYCSESRQLLSAFVRLIRISLH